MERGKNDARYSDYNRLDITSRIYEIIIFIPYRRTQKKNYS
jgi:hypothetical protein